MANPNDTDILLRIIKSAFRNPLNPTAHTVTLSSALEAMSWLETTSLTKISATLGWAEVTAQDVTVFTMAARQLVPGFALQPNFTLTTANAGFKLKNFVLHVRERNTSLMVKARAWGFRLLAAKRSRFFDKAIEEGLVPSVQDLKETKAELEQLKKFRVDTEAELQKFRVDTEAELDALKGIIRI